MENRRRTTLKVNGSNIPLRNKDQYYPEDFIQDMDYQDAKLGDFIADILHSVPCLLQGVSQLTLVSGTEINIPEVLGFVKDAKTVVRPLRAASQPSYVPTLSGDGVHYVKFAYAEQDYGSTRGKVYAAESYYWETIDSFTMTIDMNPPAGDSELCVGSFVVAGGVIIAVGELNRSPKAEFNFSKVAPGEKSIIEAWLSQSVQDKLNAAGGTVLRTFKFRGGNFSVVDLGSQKGVIVADPVPGATAFFSTEAGVALTRFDVEQAEPTSRKAASRLTGADLTVGIKTALSEASVDKIPFTFPSGLNSTRHKWTRLKCQAVGSGYSNLRVVLHDNADTELLNVLVPIGDLLPGAWFHVESLADIFTPGAAYHIHVFVADGTYVSQPFLFTDVAGSMQGAYYQVYYKPSAGFYPSGDAISIVNAAGTAYAPARAAGDDNIVGGLAPDERGDHDLMPVDFSDVGTWDSFDYDNYIGIDCLNGRIKLPAGMTFEDWGYAEFNFKLALDLVNDKFIQRYNNATTSLRDFLDKFGFLNLLDSPSSYTGEAGKMVVVKGDESGVEFADVPDHFTELEDAPASYSGHANKVVKVKATEDGLEFGDPETDVFTDLEDVPSSYSGQAGKLLKVKADESGLDYGDQAPGNFTGLDDTPDSYFGQEGKVPRVNRAADALEFVDPSTFTDLTSLRKRVETAEDHLLHLALINSYLMGKTISGQMVVDTFVDEKKSNIEETSSNKVVQLFDDCDWNNNWKEREGTPNFKNGFIRNRYQPYMLEVVDEFNLEGVGQAYKCAIDYDNTNRCYWLISHANANAIGEITKLSENMKDGKVEVLARYYIPAGGASTYWTGIASDGDYLYFTLWGSNAASKFGKVSINSDGTLGKLNKKNGEALVLDATCLEYALVANANTGYWNDVFSYNDNDIGILLCNTTTVSIYFYDKATGGAGVETVITGLGSYIGGTTTYARSMCLNENDLYIRINDTTDDKRFIYKFDLTTDLSATNVMIKSSGRWETTRAVDSAGIGEGICVGHLGDILEVTSTTSYGKFISRRALKNALWAENQVCGEYKCNASTNPTTPHAMMVEDNRYLWTQSTGTANNSLLYRFDTQTGNYKVIKLAGRDWLRVFDLTYNPNTDVVYMIGDDGTNWEIYFGDLSSFVALMADSYATLTTVTIGTNWGTIASGIGAAHTDNKTGICYDSDANILYILNDTDDKIDTLSIDGVTYVEGVYDLPAPTAFWQGIAYKNSNIYVHDRSSTTAPNRIFVIPKNKANATSMWRSHIYQDPASSFTAYGTIGIDFIGNDLVTVHLGNVLFNTIKILEDPDVMQLHTFMDSNNILLSNNVSCTTPIVQRYFDPEDFSDIRDCPDYNYCGVGYGDNGFSLLMLDEYLSGKSSTGKDRYDVTKIGTMHFERYTGSNLAVSNIINTDGGLTAISIEKELILVTCTGSSYYKESFIDLKAGTSIIINVNTNSGWNYQGTLSERNDGKGYSGSYNTELNISGIPRKLHAHTFTKDDASDYKGENPVTFVAIGTDGGCDVLRIDWDSNGNRTPVKVWNNVFNSVTTGNYATWIAPSGYLFVGVYNGNGNVYKGVFPLWDLSGDTTSGYGTLNTGYIEAGSNILGGYARDIAPNSRCWKTASGEWRHQLICGTYYSAGGIGSISLVDVENETIERIENYSGNYYGIVSCDTFEDLVFGIENDAASSTYEHGLTILKKLHFVDYSRGNVMVTANGWSIMNNSFNGGYQNIGFRTRPKMAVGSTYADGSGSPSNTSRVRFSKDHSILFYGSKLGGLQLFHFPVMDQCVHESTEFDVDSPEYYHYKETSILPD